MLDSLDSVMAVSTCCAGFGVLAPVRLSALGAGYLLSAGGGEAQGGGGRLRGREAEDAKRGEGPDPVGVCVLCGSRSCGAVDCAGRSWLRPLLH